ncbi:Chromobox protein like 3 [Pseudolycoriella hygida]|uniref:Chromobox protein like 3 n=1 Tax=Pseudolycoriella hygida TaxID=35572 RepID=A0A9Q0MTZ0_9DIPT|nr:Chromobox protein like 3 [Pseudolycoriella hygida]
MADPMKSVDLISPRGANADVIYTVEKVLDRRVRNGKTEYFLKWNGYTSDDNTWEPVENLNCPDLIITFEAARTDVPVKDIKNKRKRSVAKNKRDKSTGKTRRKITSEMENGFDRGLEPDRILGATTNAKNEIMFLMKWKNSDEANLVPAKQANLVCPQLVIQFYEDRLTFQP